MSKKPKTEKEKKDIRLEIVAQMTTLASAAFGLVAALAWNDAIQTLFNQFFPTQAALIGKFVYATLITALIVFVTTYLGHLTNKIKKS